MPLTESQVAEARSPDKIVGHCAAGALYSVRVSWLCVERARLLASAGTGPWWQMMSWAAGDTATIAASAPEWFIEIDLQIRAQQVGAKL